MLSKSDSVFLNNYAKTLVGSDLERYRSKIVLCCGVDPYEVKLSDMTDDAQLWPAVTQVDIINYLCLTTNSVTMTQMKAYKSLDSHNFFTSGYVHPTHGIKLPDSNVLLFGMVNHSQSLRERPLKLWILAKASGEVITAHCNCMAGRGEVCSHVGAVLFSIEYGVTLRDSTTCTSKPNGWLPPTLKSVPYLAIKEVDFSSKDAKRRKLYAGSSGVTTPAKQTTALTATPSDVELDALYVQVAAAWKDAAILRVLPGFCEEFAPQESRLPKPLSSLFDESTMSLPFHSLLQHCETVFSKLSITPTEAEAVEKESRAQTESAIWFSQRAGRITASRMKTACHTDPANPAVSLIKAVCYPETTRFTTNATKWGCNHEGKARQEYESAMRTVHDGVSVSDCGFYIDPTRAYVGASPDGRVSCCCCGEGILEIKCPFCAKDQSVNQYASSKNSCLKSEEGSTYLDRTHAYYYQVQTQLAVCGSDFCDFVLWTEKDIFIERIIIDREFCDNMLGRAEHIFQVAILPELVSKFFTTNRHSGLNLPISSSSVACYCQSAEEDPMMACSNTSCQFRKFHWKCLNIKVTPRAKRWFCPDCKKLNLVTKKAGKNV